MKTGYFIVILAAFFLTSCSSSVEGPEPAGPGSMAPIVTGIRIVAESGHFLGNWGNPTDGPDAEESRGRDEGLMALAPNPCIGTCLIHYRLGLSAAVRLWVVPARLAGTLGPGMESFIGAQMAAPRMTPVKTFDTDGLYEAGAYSVTWNGTDDAGNRVPSGFYRIFLSIDNTLFWRDLLFVASPEEARRILGAGD